MAIKIDLYCNDGSPIGVIPPDIYGRGVGGAELAMMSWAKTMAERGHQVRVYNDPREPGEYDGVEYLIKGSYRAQNKRDVFVLFRSPNPIVVPTKAEMKIHWSTDQYTVGDFGKDIFPFVDKVVCISPFHVDYHKGHYGVEDDKIGYFDLGVILPDYEQEVDKIPGRCIFCSVPDRGLDVLYDVWPTIKRDVPEASLVITSDYRLWGADSPRNHNHRMKWLEREGVIFLGKIEREKLVKEQLAAVCHSYPCTYEELFCISSAECQVAGAMSVTSGMGSLKTTNQYGKMLKGNPYDINWKAEFVKQVTKSLHNPMKQADINKARKRFDWQQICKQWENLIETGAF